MSLTRHRSCSTIYRKMETLLYIPGILIILYFVFAGVKKLKKTYPIAGIVLDGSVILALGITGIMKGIIAKNEGRLVILKGEGQFPIQAILGGIIISGLSIYYITVKIIKQKKIADSDANKTILFK